MPDDRSLRRLDAYLDAVPRPVARVEAIGPFTVFVNEGPGWPYYARPTPGARAPTPADVDAVRARQRELRQPEAFEWIVNLCPSVGSACRATGMRVEDGRPLLQLAPGGPRHVITPEHADIRFVGPHDPDLRLVEAVARVGFQAPGTAVGATGTEALTASAATFTEDDISFRRARIASGRTVVAAAWVEGWPVAVGAHQPMDGATEIVGVACLPAYRRRGFGTAVTAALADHAARRGIETIMLSASDDAVARVYEDVGFVRIGSAGEASVAT
jgi:ribosomal protein S18 acetylase RimI-like enzyme